MLSRFALRPALKLSSSPLITFQRFASDDYHGWSTTKEVIVEEVEITDLSKHVSTEITDYVPRPSPFNSPLRDHVNFPKIKPLDKPLPTRLGMFPESWFQFLYPKLGVTGPYTLGAGIILFFINKELYLIDDHDFKHTIAFFAWMYIITKSPLGTMLRDFVWSNEDGVDECLNNLRKYNEELRVEAIDYEKEEQWRQEGRKLIFDARKENVALQLEASYRETFMNSYNELKRRLDYQVEISKIDQRIKNQFMVQWVLDRVNESLNQTSEKENLKQCIANLNLLAAKI